MLVTRDRILDLPVVSLQTGQRLAELSSAIIDPRQLHVVAFYCEGPGLDINPSVLHTEDIREVSSLGLIVDGADDLMPPEGLVRLQQIIDFNFTLEDKPVIDDQGAKVGKVGSYSLETATFYILKLHVKPNFLQAWSIAERIIDRSQIVEITDKHIVVKAPTVNAASQSVFDNPFSKTQPDAMHRTAQN